MKGGIYPSPKLEAIGLGYGVICYFHINPETKESELLFSEKIAEAKAILKKEEELARSTNYPLDSRNRELP